MLYLWIQRPYVTLSPYHGLIRDLLKRSGALRTHWNGLQLVPDAVEVSDATPESYLPVVLKEPEGKGFPVSKFHLDPFFYASLHISPKATSFWQPIITPQAPVLIKPW